MGLDMYLEGKKYIGGEFNENGEDVVIRKKAKWDKEEEVFTFNSKDISSIIVPLGYWRKANSIHRWFVKHCFDGNYNDYHGEDIEVDIEQLKELKSLCKKVLDELNKAISIDEKKEIIDNMLPMQDGFFFGYNDGEDGIRWYEEDMRETIKVLTEALKKIKKYKIWHIFYNASW